MRAPASVLLVVALLLGGCLGTGAPSDLLAGPATRVASFTSALTLSAVPPAEESTVATGSFYAAWQSGKDFPTWLAEPETVDVVVENMSVHLRVRATGPVVESPPFPDIMVYGGSGGAWMAFGAATTPPVLVPGQDYVLDVELEAPQGGLYLPAGESFGLKVVPVMQQNDAADILIVVGGEDGSRAEWSVIPTPRVDVPLTVGSAEGATRGSAYAGAAAPPEVSHMTSIALEAAPSHLLAWMNVTSHSGVPDLDLALIGPDGEEVAFSGTPTPREFLRLGPANLRGPGEYRLVVTSYGSAQATFSLEWRVG